MEQFCSKYGGYPVSLNPAHLLTDFKDEPQAAFGETAANVLLYMPFAFFLRAKTKISFVSASLIGLALSILMETMQGTGNFGLASCAYREADIADVIKNTLGAVLGSWLYSYVIKEEKASEKKA